MSRDLIDCRRCGDQFKLVSAAMRHAQREHGAKNNIWAARMLRAYPPIKLKGGLIIHTFEPMEVRRR